MAAERLVTWSLAKIAERWLLIVLEARWRRRAMAEFGSPGC
jgi:hypothetical protein